MCSVFWLLDCVLSPAGMATGCPRSTSTAVGLPWDQNINANMSLQILKLPILIISICLFFLHETNIHTLNKCMCIQERYAYTPYKENWVWFIIFVVFDKYRFFRYVMVLKEYGVGSKLRNLLWKEQDVSSSPKLLWMGVCATSLSGNTPFHLVECCIFREKIIWCSL